MLAVRPSRSLLVLLFVGRGLFVVCGCCVPLPTQETGHSSQNPFSHQVKDVGAAPWSLSSASLQVDGCSVGGVWLAHTFAFFCLISKHLSTSLVLWGGPPGGGTG